MECESITPEKVWLTLLAVRVPATGVGRMYADADGTWPLYDKDSPELTFVVQAILDMLAGKEPTGRPVIQPPKMIPTTETVAESYGGGFHVNSTFDGCGHKNYGTSTKQATVFDDCPVCGHLYCDSCNFDRHICGGCGGDYLHGRPVGGDPNHDCTGD